MDFRVQLSIRPDDTSAATCHTYPDRPPILVVQGAGHTFTITATTDADPAELVGFAHALRDASAIYARAVEQGAAYRERNHDYDTDDSRPRPYPRYNPA